jgi:hypothetical protein
MNDETLTRLVTDAVADVEPTDRLDQIRVLAREQRSGRRRGWYAAGGVALATAAAVTAFAVLGTDEPRTTAPDLADTPTPSASTGVGPEERPQVGYFVGDTARGPRLFRDLVLLPEEGSAVSLSLQALETGSLDPDYRTLWPAGSFAGAEVRGDVIEVTLADATLRDRPAGMSAEEAAIAVEQVIWSVQSADGSERAVQFRYGDNPIDQVYGVPTSEPLARGEENDVRALMNIYFPQEGAVVSGSFRADGENNGNEASMNWRIEDADGRPVLEGFATAEGWIDGLYPWETDPIDVSALAPGTYTFVASNPDLSDGEGFRPDTDTRSIIVE